MNKVLILAVHPDDETLGCGGTLLKHKENHDEIHWVIGTEMKESDGYDKTTIQIREKEIAAVEKLYQFDSLHRLGFSTMKVDEYSVSDLIGAFSKVINLIKPTIIYLPFKSDVHSDHRYLFNAAYSCTKSFRYPFIKKILMVETLSETEFAPSTQENSFVPNTFVDITAHMQKKLQIMELFKSEVSNHPFPRSIENIKALATFRGAMSNCRYAESFVLLKSIE